MATQVAKLSWFRRLLRWMLWLTLLGFLTSVALACVAAYLLMPEFERYESQVEALRTRESFGPGWQFHSRLYSAPLELTVGMTLSMRRLQEHLDARAYTVMPTSKTRALPREKAGAASKPAAREGVPPWVPFGSTAAPSRAADASRPMPAGPLPEGSFRVNPTSIEIGLRGYQLPNQVIPPAQVRVRFFQGKVVEVTPLGETQELQRYALEPILLTELLGDPPRRSTFVPLKHIPQHVQDAVIASEDSRFMSHPGIDPVGVLRAMRANLQAGAFRQGASTITQQLARTLFLSTERTYQRKLSELAIALLLDRRMSKAELLELYLNSVYMGQVDGVAVHGVEEAARAYFDKPVAELTLGEAATLSGIIPAPNAFSPIRNLERARERRNLVLGLLRDQHLASPEAVEAGLNAPLEVRVPLPIPVRYGYYVSFARDFLKTTLGEGYELRGLTLFAALDVALQERAEQSLIQALEAREKGWGRLPEPLQGAAFLMDHQTGQVLAVAGGRGYDTNPFNRAFQARRQPGSAFKPIAYAAALDGAEGLTPYTPATVVPDVRRVFQVKEGDWRPRNYEGEYHEQVTLAKALVKSLNVATVNLVDQIGPERVVKLASRLGIEGLKPVLSIGLGTNEVTLAQLTSAFSSFPGRGLRIEPQPVARVMDLWGKTIWTPPQPAEQVLKPATAALMVEMLRNVVIYGTAWTLRTEGYYNRPTAGKTGTSQDENDAWFIGFSPEWILGTWVGFDTPRHLFGSAADVAVPLWGTVMTELAGDLPATDFTLSADLEYAWIDPFSGGRAGSLCPSNMRVAFLKGTLPTFSCPLSHDEPLEGEGTEEGQEGDEGVTPGSSAEPAPASSDGAPSTGGSTPKTPPRSDAEPGKTTQLEPRSTQLEPRAAPASKE